MPFKTPEIQTAPRRPVSASCADDTLVLKHDGEYHFVHVGDVVWVRSEGDFVKVQTTHGAHLVRSSLARLESLLDPQHFLRLHRSHLVARAHLRKVFVVERGDYAVVTSDGTKLRVSRPYFAALRQLLYRLTV